jgi:hypothetical protein
MRSFAVRSRLNFSILKHLFSSPVIGLVFENKNTQNKVSDEDNCRIDWQVVRTIVEDISLVPCQSSLFQIHRVV